MDMLPLVAAAPGGLCTVSGRVLGGLCTVSGRVRGGLCIVSGRVRGGLCRVSGRVLETSTNQCYNNFINKGRECIHEVTRIRGNVS